MAIYEAFSYPLLVRHKACFCSKTTIFYLLTTILSFLLPILLIYSEGFWRDVDHFSEQPDIAFKHKMILLLETENIDDVIFWSTYKTLNTLVLQKMQQRIPMIEHREEDYNRDGRFDELLMTIDIPLVKQEALSLKLLLIFDFKLHLYSKFQMEGAAFISYSSASPGSSLHILGDLQLLQREPLKYSGRDFTYNVSVIDESNDDISSFLKFENIFMRYVKRNVTTSLENQYSVWKSGRGENTPFTIKLAIKYPYQTILYKVPLWQHVKWFIVQYIAYFTIFHFIFYRIKLYIFKKQLVPSIVLNPIHSMKRN